MGQTDAYLVLSDLTWMALEDADDAQAEDLLDRLSAMDVNTLQREWLQLLAKERLQPQPASAWQALRERSPSLMRHCPLLGTSDDVQARRVGAAMQLPNLITVLAW